MDNKIYRREKLQIVGQLKDNNIVTTDYKINCEVIGPTGKLIQLIPLELDYNNRTYSCIVDTEELLGKIRFRFVVVNRSGDQVISDSFIDKTIYP